MAAPVNHPSQVQMPLGCLHVNRMVKIFGNMSMSQTLIALKAVDGNRDLSVPANLFHLNSYCLIRSGDVKSSLYMATTSSNDGNSSVVHKTDGFYRFVILAESTDSSENCASSSEIIWLRKGRATFTQ